MTAKGTSLSYLTAPIAGQQWRKDAACLGCDPEIFFPEEGDYETRDRAVAICMGCPVRVPCLRWGMQVNDHFAILGGLTKRQRTYLQKKRSAWKRFTSRGN